MALSALTHDADGAFKCAVLGYGFMLDLATSTAVAKAAAQFGFVNPCAGRSIDDFPANIPLLLVRAGQDQMPGLNETIDLFMAAALAHNLPGLRRRVPAPCASLAHRPH